MPWRWWFHRKPADEPSKLQPYLALVESQQAEVAQIVARLQHRRDQNHFREAFQQALWGDR